MKHGADTAAPSVVHASHRMRLARRLLDAHRGLDDSSLLVCLTGSVAQGLADERSGVDLVVVMAELPAADRLEQACAAAGSSPWRQPVAGDAGWAELHARFSIDGIDARVLYDTRVRMRRGLDDLLHGPQPSGPLHDLAQGLVDGVPLFGHRPLEALQAELRAFSDPLALAMARHYTARPTPWSELMRLTHRDAPLVLRELQIALCRQLLGQLAALNRCYLGPLRQTRLHALAASFERTPPGLADRIESLLSAPPRTAGVGLHALEGDVLALLGAAFPALDLGPLLEARAASGIGGH